VHQRGAGRLSATPPLRTDHRGTARNCPVRDQNPARRSPPQRTTRTRPARTARVARRMATSDYPLEWLGGNITAPQRTVVYRQQRTITAHRQWQRGHQKKVHSGRSRHCGPIAIGDPAAAARAAGATVTTYNGLGAPIASVGKQFRGRSRTATFAKQQSCGHGYRDEPHQRGVVESRPPRRTRHALDPKRISFL